MFKSDGFDNSQFTPHDQQRRPRSNYRPNYAQQEDQSSSTLINEDESGINNNRGGDARTSTTQRHDVTNPFTQTTQKGVPGSTMRPMTGRAGDFNEQQREPMTNAELYYQPQSTSRRPSGL